MNRQMKNGLCVSAVCVWIVLALALPLLIPAGHALADETVVYFYQYAGDGCHDMICCRYVNGVYEELWRDLEFCQYDNNGVCRFCGCKPDGEREESACKHPDTTVMKFVRQTCESVDDQYHAVYLEQTETTYCATCGSRLGTTVYRKTLGKEPHQYFRGACRRCGQKDSEYNPIEVFVKKYNYDGNDAGAVSAADEKRLINNMIRRLQDAKLDENDIREVVRYLQTTDDEEMKELWLSMFSDPDKLEIRTHTDAGISSFSDWNWDNGRCFIDLQYVNGRVAPREIIHEVGHATDYYHAYHSLQLTTKNDLYGYFSDAGLTVKNDTLEAIRQQVMERIHIYIDDMQRKPSIWRDDRKIREADEKGVQVMNFITELIASYNIPYDDEFHPITQEQLLQRLVAKYFGEEGIPDCIDYQAIIRDVLYNFRTVDDALTKFKPGLQGLNWKQAYRIMVSDAYGGVTNNEIMDGMGHFVLDRWGENAGKDLKTLHENYWYFTEDNIVGGYYPRMSLEPWAEYTECKLMNIENADAVADAFFPGLGFQEKKKTMHLALTDLMNESGIKDYAAD